MFTITLVHNSVLSIVALYRSINVLQKNISTESRKQQNFHNVLIFCNQYKLSFTILFSSLASNLTAQ